MKTLTALIILLPAIFFGQSWENTFGKGFGRYAIQNTEGDYVITGYTYSHDIFLLKVDQNGDTIWRKIYNSTEDDKSNFVQQTTDGGYIIVGSRDTSMDFEDVYIIKADINGDTLWTEKYGGPNIDAGYSSVQTTDGNYVITGRSGFQLLLMKINNNGEVIWSKTYGEQFRNSGSSIQQTSDTCLIVTGYVFNGDIGNCVYILKSDYNGDTLWTKIIHITGEEFGSSIHQTIDGGYIITGQTWSSTSSYDVLLLKTDEFGNTLWYKSYGGSDGDYGSSIQQTNDDGYIICGTKDQVPYTSEIYLIKTTNTGDTLWTETYGGDGHHIGYAVQQTFDNGYLLTGTCSSDIGFVACLIKTDENGGILSTIEIPITDPNRRLLKIIDFSGREIRNLEMYQPFIEVYDDGTTQKKMIIK